MRERCEGYRTFRSSSGPGRRAGSSDDILSDSELGEDAPRPMAVEGTGEVVSVRLGDLCGRLTVVVWCANLPGVDERFARSQERQAQGPPATKRSTSRPVGRVG